MLSRVPRVARVFVLLVAVSAAVVGCAAPTTPTQRPSELTATPSVPATSAVPGTGAAAVTKVEVPDVVGFDMVTGRMVLGEAHLTFEIVDKTGSDDTKMDDSVVITKQDPKAGTMVDSGSTVVLTLKKK